MTCGGMNHRKSRKRKRVNHESGNTIGGCDGRWSPAFRRIRGPAEAGTPTGTRAVSESRAMYHDYVDGPSRNMSSHKWLQQGESAQTRETRIAKPVSKSTIRG